RVAVGDRVGRRGGADRVGIDGRGEGGVALDGGGRRGAADGDRDLLAGRRGRRRRQGARDGDRGGAVADRLRGRQAAERRARLRDVDRDGLVHRCVVVGRVVRDEVLRERLVARAQDRAGGRGVGEGARDGRPVIRVGGRGVELRRRERGAVDYAARVAPGDRRGGQAGRDSADLVTQRLGEPEIAVGPSRDPCGAAAAGGDGIFGEAARGGHPADLVAP